MIASTHAKISRAKQKNIDADKLSPNQIYVFPNKIAPNTDPSLANVIFKPNANANSLPKNHLLTIYD